MILFESSGSQMIDFLKSKGIKAYNEIKEIAEHPDLLFSNDLRQINAEASYNMYTIQSLNKLAKKKGISIVELEKVFSFVEASWETYLKKYYSGKAFFFYMWGDNLIPAIRVSVVSYFKGLELPFSCELNKVSDMQNIFKAYVENAQFNGLVITMQEEVTDEGEESEIEQDFCLTVYSKIISC
ncbi:hypothetical protein [Aneurinibacillus aneurinilyticus]|nr:hypothetical protein [Aneurinibacillus aneurinilyticus]